MRLLHPIRGTATRTRSKLVAALAVALALPLSGGLLSAPAYAANPVTPGNFRGLGFDQCEAPSQSAMSAWRRSSPYRAAGIYISGDSRGCQRQTYLRPTWVARQLAGGWHLMPITLGPQAWCTTRERYLHQVRINPSTTSGYRRARLQGQAEAKKAVGVARGLGIVAGSTIFYDLEAFDTRRSTSCTNSALWFVNSWTRQLHASGYAAGYYSSAASGIRMLDDARVRPGNSIVLPDQIWIADWNGKANTDSSYIRSDGWQPYGRAHQYRGGNPETHGGVTINIDRNYVALRTPKLPRSASPRPTPMPTPAPSTSDPQCTTASISQSAYRFTNSTTRSQLYVPLQCLLKQQGLYPHRVTGNWNKYTVSGLRTFQRNVGHSLRHGFTRRDWITLITAGNHGTVLSPGSRSTDVLRVQRAMNAAGSSALTVSGAYDTATRNAVVAYQRKVGIRATGNVASLTWGALKAGRF
ncbi:MAG: glycoside hydrolase domain-containing protein [Marmoricola sp.]